MGGRGKRVYADYPQRKQRTPVPYFELAEDQVCTPGTGTVQCRGLRPRVQITNVDAEDRFLMAQALDDEDLALALSMADLWL